MKKLVINTIIVIMIFSFFGIMLNYSYAVTGIDTNFYKPSNLTEVTNASELFKVGKTIIGWANLIATIISVIVLAMLGIKYMVGSVEEKAEYKKSMKPYLIGCILVFGITTILNIVSEVAQIFNK